MVLLIIKVGGVLTFSYSFVDEWERNNDMLGNFMSAFSSFSDEFFSEEFDRAKFGKYTVLMKAIPNFLVCYLFKGQTYLTSQKLSKFTEQIQKRSLIWQTLEKYDMTNQVLELKDCPSLKPLIIEIFKEKSIELNV